MMNNDELLLERLNARADLQEATRNNYGSAEYNWAEIRATRANDEYNWREGGGEPRDYSDPWDESCESEEDTTPQGGCMVLIALVLPVLALLIPVLV